MKKQIVSLLALAMLGLGVSCTKDDDGLSNDRVDVESVRSTAMAGEWRITYYFDSDKDETSDYSGFTFRFNDDGSLVAVNGDTEITGSWSVTDSDDSDDDDNPESDTDFNIAFAAPEIFVELTDDWDIQKYTDTKIELVDVSGGDGSIDYLTFERN